MPSTLQQKDGPMYAVSRLHTLLPTQDKSNICISNIAIHCLWLGITYHHAKVISGSTTSHLLSLFGVLIVRSFFQLLGQWSLIQRPSMMSSRMLRFPNDINQMYRMDTEISGFPFRNRAPLGVDRLPKGASMAD